MLDYNYAIITNKAFLLSVAFFTGQSDTVSKRK